ncbi:hybrid sensor histidine kinase/response regulator [Chamaesiphon minutus]|uniref:Response regulator with CheY-like receiver domain and winged-helix DNA-binding domain n=1 Tax=Chamaesiphon minutus (strain ATCC 27169 / PCC 6605) TaxID=1173020 RepID=K9UI56_CHAP6|nr:response regulator [Chamaesiphon minutus]AFY94500.1 response regulator with CheY-like receiver domain and winged-helix DNA-binding domain [Chamaesiphon minutus PCC 6605]
MAAMNNHTILVVDDERANFELIETLLTIDKYNLHYISSGEEVFAAIDRLDPDVILLDLMMPGMDGLAVCQRLRLMRKWRSIPIIIVTAAAGKSILASCLDAGADDFINKPVDGLELRARVKSMVRNKKQFDRIESLSKLQQNNIASLENNLGELVGDLAIGFVTELSTPLTSIQEQLEELNTNLDRFSTTQTRYLVELASKSANNIQKTTYKFWTYLDFAAEKKQLYTDEICNIKEIIEQISIVQAQWINRESDLIIDIQIASVAVTAKHCELIIKELLDNAFKFSDVGTTIEMCGRIIGKSFHFWIGDRRSDYPIDRPISNSNLQEQELGLGLKVVKKIVGMYDGCFAIDINERNETIVYLTLPLGAAEHQK